MKLILLESRNQYDQKVLHGVFSSREEAEQAILSVQAAFNVQEEEYEEYKNRVSSFFFTFTEISLDEVVCT